MVVCGDVRVHVEVGVVVCAWEGVVCAWEGVECMGGCGMCMGGCGSAWEGVVVHGRVW